MQDLNFRANRVRKFHKDDFILDKLNKLDAKGQKNIYISLIEKIFDFAAFLLGYEEDDEASSSGMTAQTGDKNLRVVIAYDESGSDNYGDNDNDKPDAGSSGDCNSGLAASLALIGFAFTHRHRKRR
ncbi:MAG: hypothetical protein IJQ56_10675 [Synergistaceae bacterium]|nr:hypothetical protein [Synergistaceae bacterium]